jgi:hypothetical protein
MRKFDYEMMFSDDRSTDDVVNAAWLARSDLFAWVVVGWLDGTRFEVTSSTEAGTDP